MKPKHLKLEVHSAFKELFGKDFTAGQAINVYTASPSCTHSDLKAARQFIRRNILRLVEAGEIEKVDSLSSRQKYRITAQFNLRLQSDKQIIAADPTENKISDYGVESNKNLTNRLNHQKLELLTAMGEAEEYDAVYKEIPEMRGQIQPLYNNSRDRCSKLLGKVKALENLISLNAR